MRKFAFKKVKLHIFAASKHEIEYESGRFTGTAREVPSKVGSC